MDPPASPPPTFMASFTDAQETRICGRDTCGQAYRNCTQDEKLRWKRLTNSRNTFGETVRWVCGACAEYYRNKLTTQHRDNTINASRDISVNDIRKNVAAANKGKGSRKLVEVVSSIVPQMSSVSGQASSTQDRVQGNQNAWTHGRTYESQSWPLRPSRPSQQPSRPLQPQAAAKRRGYTQNHPHYQNQLDHWSRKASHSGSVIEVVAVLVFMGVVYPGQKSLTVIDSCLEGLNNVDAHIGGDDLHRMCYNALQKKWLAWSNGYPVPMERTTLRGAKVYAPIAGKDLAEPVKEHDAIWHFFFKVRGKGPEPKFKAEQLQLAVVLDYEDVAHAELRREELNPDIGANTSTKTTGRRQKRKTRRKLTYATSDFEVTDSEDSVALTAGPVSKSFVNTPQTPVEGNLDSDEGPEEVDSEVTGAVSSKRGRSITVPPENSSKRQKQLDFVSPQRDQFLSALREQHRHSNVQDTATLLNKLAFQCVFYEIPAATYHPDKLPRNALTLQDSDIRVHHGTLSVDLAPGSSQMGSFKTSHPGKVQLNDKSELLPFTNGTVCVKQMYERRKQNGGNGAISRLKGHVELEALLVECNCIRWASILMDLTYQFIDREVKKRGEPPHPIPPLRFTRVMIALVTDLPTPKAFLVEEWIGSSSGDHRFTKYLNNRVPHHISDSVPQAPKAREITDFLIFAQHVQWKKSQYLAFTSDYQGAGDLLTDPQIISNPIHGNLFGDGNVPSAFKEFRSNHRCNRYCEFFNLTLDIPILEALP